MAFEMIKINYSLWPNFHPKPRRLTSPFHPSQLAKYLLWNTLFYPIHPSLEMPHVPQVGCLMFLEGSFTSCSALPVILWQPKIYFSTTLCAWFPVAHTLIFSAMN